MAVTFGKSPLTAGGTVLLFHLLAGPLSEGLPHDFGTTFGQSAMTPGRAGYYRR